MKIVFTLPIVLFLVLCYATQSGSASAQSTEEQSAKPDVRVGHVMIYDTTLRKIILLDGYQGSYKPEQGEIWSWNGKQWKLIPGVGPTVRGLSGAVFDPRRKRIVMYGGVGKKGYEDLRGDTWEWDGGKWFQMDDKSIGTRDHHAMAYDASRGKTVMYGGVSSNRSLPSKDWVYPTDTYEWDGKQWSKISTPGPGDRAHFAMAYDSKRKQVILFGGLTNGKRSNDTWAWNGKTWQKLSDEGPPPRSRHRMAFDSRAGVVILYGGDGVKTEPGNGFRVLEDMWQWDGTRWTEIKTPGLGKRFMHAMAYDEARGKVVLYGGLDGQQKALDDTWEWDGKQWKQIN